MEAQFNQAVAENAFTANDSAFMGMQNPIHVNACPTHVNACPTHVSASMPLIWKAAKEVEQDCPALAGDSYSIETESLEWCCPEGRFPSFDVRLQAYLRSEQDRDLLVVFLQEAMERYCAAVVERSLHDQSTTISTAA